MHAGASTNNADSSASGEPQRSYNNLARPSPLAASAVRVVAALAQPLRIVHTARPTAPNLPVLNVILEAIPNRGSVHRGADRRVPGLESHIHAISRKHPAHYIAVGDKHVI